MLNVAKFVLVKSLPRQFMYEQTDPNIKPDEHNCHFISSPPTYYSNSVIANDSLVRSEVETIADESAASVVLYKQCTITVH